MRRLSKLSNVKTAKVKLHAAFRRLSAAKRVVAEEAAEQKAAEAEAAALEARLEAEAFELEEQRNARRREVLLSTA